MLFMHPGQRQIICYKCRQKWYDPAVIKRSLTHTLLDRTWKTAYRRAQETVKAKEALNVGLENYGKNRCALGPARGLRRHLIHIECSKVPRKVPFLRKPEKRAFAID